MKQQLAPRNSPRAMTELVVIGGGGVGKSTLTIMYTQNFFISTYDPTIEDTYRRQVDVDNQIQLLQILDTAGQEEYSVMRDGWFRNGDCFLLVFSATSRRSFDELEAFRTQLLRVKDKDSLKDTIGLVIVMNKMDLKDEHQVTEDEAEEKAREWGVPLVKASAKTGHNVKECYEELVREHRHCLAVAESPETRSLAEKRRNVFKSMCTIM